LEQIGGVSGKGDSLRAVGEGEAAKKQTFAVHEEEEENGVDQMLVARIRRKMFKEKKARDMKVRPESELVLGAGCGFVPGDQSGTAREAL